MTDINSWGDYLTARALGHPTGPPPGPDGYLCRPDDPCGHCDLCDPTRPFTEPSDNGQHEEEPEWGEDDPVFVHWPDLWDDEDHSEWLYEPVLALGRGHAIYAGHKQGKSLFVFWICTQLAARGDVDVIYLDYEMTRDDLRERLDDMGYGPDSGCLDRIHYALLPSLPPLDTGEGAGALLELIDSINTEGRHLLVIIDTTSRAAQGEENSADTFREFYRWTGITLKRRGITYARLDHAGKNALKGQRGSSGKGDDVDIIWRLTQADDGIKLHRDAARMAWVDENHEFKMTQNPLQFDPGAKLWPAGTKPLAEALKPFDIPPGTPRAKVRALMKEHDIHGGNALVGKALEYLWTAGWTKVTVIEPDQPVDQPPENAMTSMDQPLDQPGPEVSGDVGPVSIPKDGPVPPDHQPDPYELTHSCTRCDRPATDISGLCPGCQANPGTLPPLNRNELF